MIKNKKHFIKKYNIGNYIFLLWMMFFVSAYVGLSINALLYPINQSYHEYLFGTQPDVYPFFFMLIIASMLFISLLTITLKEKNYRIPIFLIFLLLASFFIISVLSKTVISLLAFIWIFILGWVLGKKIVGLILKQHNLSWLEVGMLSIALGYGVYSFFILALSITGLLYPVVVYSVLILFSLMFLQDILRLFKEIFYQIKNFSFFIKSTPNSILVTVLISLMLIVMLVNFIYAVAPEIEYDGLSYHLTLPKIYIAYHHIINLPDIHYARNIEMLYALGMIIGGQIAAKLISYSFGILIVLSIICFTKRFFSFETAIIAASLFYILPYVSWLTTTTDTELAVGFYIISVIFVLFLWRENNEKILLFLCGLLSGLTLSVKLESILFLIPIILSILIFSYCSSDKKFSRIILDLVIFGFPFLIISIPWFLIIYHQTGNPVFPFFNAIFKSPLNAIFKSSLIASVNTYADWIRFGMGHGLKAILFFPWYVSYKSIKYGGIPNGTIGIVILLSLPVIFFIKKSRGIFILLFISIVSIVIWFNIGYLRYIIPIFAVLSILAGYVLSYFISNYSTFYKYICCIMLVIYLLACIPIHLSSFYNIPGRIPYKVAFGLESKNDYLAKVINIYPAIQYLNQHYDSNKIKLFLLGWEHRYYLDASLNVRVKFAHSELRKLFPSNNELFSYLHKKGFTHILIDIATAQKNNLKLIEDEIIKKHYAKLEYESKHARLYKLEYNR